VPIRFRCVYCGQLLSIATRKAGNSVDCPKCSHPNTVPGKSPETKAAVAAPARGSKVSKAFESKKFDEWIGRSDRDVEEEPKEKAFEIPDEDSGSNVYEANESGGSESASAVEEPWRREPEGLPAPRTGDFDDDDEIEAISSRSNTIPLAAGAVALLLVAFGIGLLVGRYAFPAAGSDKSSFAKPAKAATKPAEQTKDVVAAGEANAPAVVSEFRISGKVEVQNDPARPATSDLGASVIAFPANALPPAGQKIPSAGLRPGDGWTGPGKEGLEKIGGHMGAVRGDGTFEIPLVTEGAYWVLILSKNSPRSANTKLFQSEMETLGNTFEDVSSLLGKNDYLLVSRTVKSHESSPINHVFRYVP